MSKSSFGTAALATFAAATLVGFAVSSATAADLRPAPYRAPPAPPPPPVFSWTGCYIGGNIGGGWAEKSWSDVSGFVTGVPGADLGSHTASGVIGGGQIGCDYQAGLWVFGVQGMFEGSGMDGSNAQPLGSFVNSTTIPWLATVTGRIGLTAAPTVLLYAKGGGAWVRDEFSLTGVGGTVASADTTPSGWTVGGGVEWAFAGNWSAFAEYNYMDFGTSGVTFTSATGGTTFPVNIKQNINSVMVGINYRFGASGY
jgi:outer membrane immunogenic protein